MLQYWKTYTKDWQRWGITLLSASAAALLAQYCGLPAAWLIGALVATILITLLNRAPRRFPAPLTTAYQAIIGMALSASVQPAYLVALAHDWLLIVGVVMVVLLLGIGCGLVMGRISGLPVATMVLGTVPGAASGIIAMADDLKADVRIVSFMQYMRMIVVIILTSLLSHALLMLNGHPNATHIVQATHVEDNHWLVYDITLLLTCGGVWLGRLTRFPAGALIGPLVLGSIAGLVGIPHGVWPLGVLPLAYLLMGIQVGMRFDLPALRLVGRLAPLIVGEMIILILACSACGLLLSHLAGVDFLSGYLATNPGGMDTIAAIALDTGANLSLVLATQLLRFFSILLLAPPVIRWLGARMHGRRCEIKEEQPVSAENPSLLYQHVPPAA